MSLIHLARVCANCSCDHSYVNCRSELNLTIYVRIVSVQQKNTQTPKQRQTDKHMNESASVWFSITQTNVSLSPPHVHMPWLVLKWAVASIIQFSFSFKDSEYRTRLASSKRLAPLLSCRAVHHHLGFFPKSVPKSEAFMKYINKPKCTFGKWRTILEKSLSVGEDWKCVDVKDVARGRLKRFSAVNGFELYKQILFICCYCPNL